MSEWVWIVGGGELQLPAIREAKRRGYKVIVSDGNELCVAYNQVDLFLHLDTYDAIEHARVASRLRSEDYKIRGVLCPGADVGPTVSAIVEVLNLRAVPYYIAERVRNKGMMRVVLGLLYPRYRVVHFPTDILLERWIWFPCVVKPLDNCATRGVSLVNRPDTLLEAVQYALSSNKYACGAIVEECLYGEEHALDFFIVAGKAIWVNGTTRLYRTHIPGTREPLFGIEAAAINPWQPPREVVDLATNAAAKLGVTEGPFKMDIVNDPRYGWCIYECATRLSGGWDSSYMSPLVGKDITGLLLDYSTGIKLTEELIREKTQWNGKYACFYVPYYKPGKIDGWKEICYDNTSTIANLFIRSNTEIADLKTCADRPVYIIATGSSLLNALRNAGRVRRYIQPKYKDGDA